MLNTSTLFDNIVHRYYITIYIHIYQYMVLFGRALKFRSISTQTHTGVPHMYPFEAVALKFPTVPDLVKAHVLCECLLGNSLTQ